ncbi:MAG: hypothetical protein AAF656_00330, partial [Planctomycetota bacterium]
MAALQQVSANTPTLPHTFDIKSGVFFPAYGNHPADYTQHATPGDAILALVDRPLRLPSEVVRALDDRDTLQIGA